VLEQASPLALGMLRVREPQLEQLRERRRVSRLELPQAPRLVWVSRQEPPLRMVLQPLERKHRPQLSSLT